MNKSSVEQGKSRKSSLGGNSGNPIHTKPTLYEQCVALVIKKEYKQARKLFKLLPQDVIDRIISSKNGTRD